MSSSSFIVFPIFPRSSVEPPEPPATELVPEAVPVSASPQRSCAESVMVWPMKGNEKWPMVETKDGRFQIRPKGYCNYDNYNNYKTRSAEMSIPYPILGEHKSGVDIQTAAITW